MGVVPDLRKGEWHFSQEPPNINSIQGPSELSIDQRQELESLVTHYFQLMGDKLGQTTMVRHKIVTDSPPIKQRYYRVSPVFQKAIDEQLDEMLKLDIVETSSSGWSSPVLMVPKKERTYRFCIDYRRLNFVTQKDAYPMPYISTILDQLKDAKYLSSLDIRSAYWQVMLDEESKPYTAFTVPSRGLFQFKRMPFGLSNAPATFQRLVDSILGPEFEPKVFVYLDDIIIISSTFEEHLDILRGVFDRLVKAGSTLSRDKCQFCRPELKYLGYVVSREGLHVDPDKVRCIVELSPPTSVSKIRAFLGTTGWYRKFIPDYATKTAPLTALLKKNSRFVWARECQEAFDILKSCLVSAPILKCPDFSKPFVLQTDASGYGIGCVLTQVWDDGEHVVCYLSRSLTKTERKWTTTERELMAVLWSVEKLRCYLEGTKFTVVTDHYSLKWLDNLKEPTGRLGRWALKMQQFDFDVIHRKGKDHLVPDMLSREVPEINVLTTTTTAPDRWYNNLFHEVKEYPRKYPAFRVQNSYLYKYVSHPYPELCEESDYWRRVIPKEERICLIRHAHDSPTSGHTGVFKTFSRLSQSYFWPKMRSDVARYVRKCEVCAAAKPEQKKMAGQMIGDGFKPTKPWEIISVDLIGPLPRTTHGYKYVLVVVDYFSKLPLLFPLRTATAATIGRHMEESVFLLFGVPNTILLDNGKQLVSKSLSNLVQRYEVKLKFTPLYHPQANPTERTNREIKKILRCYLGKDQTTWGTILQKVACAIRTSKHESTGFTPYFINFGREMQLSGRNQPTVEGEDQQDPISALPRKEMGMKRLFEEVQVRLAKAREVTSRAYNLRRRSVEYQIGDRVWRRNFQLSNEANRYTASLAPKFLGPFVIRRKIGYNTYLLSTHTNRPAGRYHVKDLKPLVEDSDESESTD